MWSGARTDDDLISNFSEIIIDNRCSFKHMPLKISSAEWTILFRRQHFQCFISVLQVIMEYEYSTMSGGNIIVSQSAHCYARRKLIRKFNLSAEQTPVGSTLMDWYWVFLGILVHIWLYSEYHNTEKAELSLTHWVRDKIAAIFQTTFSNAFPWMKMYKLRLRFHWSSFPRVQFPLFQHWFR